MLTGACAEGSPGLLPVMSSIAGKAASLAMLSLCAACLGERSEEPAESFDFEEVFATVREISLEEPEGLPITGIDDFVVLGNGDLVVVDSRSTQVRLHSGDGGFDRIVGQAGRGPGEFRRPLGVAALPDGGFLVADAAPVLTRFDPSGEYVEALPIDGLGAVEVETLPGGRLLFASSDGESVRYFHSALELWRPEPLHVRDSIFTTNEEWRVAVRDYATPFDDGVIIAASLRYPLLHFDLGSGSRSAFGSEPASWTQATRPEPSAAVRERLPGWLRSFTFVAGVQSVADRWLLVQHARFVGAPDAPLSALFVWEPYAVDVYGTDGSRILEDVAVPGRILDAVDSLVYVVTSEPPYGWGISLVRPEVP